jgi:hypothetical protein
MEPEGSLPSSQELSNCTYPEPDQSSPHHPIVSLNGPSYCYISTDVLAFLVVSFLLAFLPITYTRSSSPPFVPLLIAPGKDGKRVEFLTGAQGVDYKHLEDIQTLIDRRSHKLPSIFNKECRLPFSVNFIYVVSEVPKYANLKGIISLDVKTCTPEKAHRY